MEKLIILTIALLFLSNAFANDADKNQTGNIFYQTFKIIRANFSNNETDNKSGDDPAWGSIGLLNTESDFGRVPSETQRRNSGRNTTAGREFAMPPPFEPKIKRLNNQV